MLGLRRRNAGGYVGISLHDGNLSKSSGSIFLSSQKMRLLLNDQLMVFGSQSKSLPRIFDIGISVFKNALVAIAPKVTIIFGFISESCFKINGMHVSISSGSGLRLLGGL